MISNLGHSIIDTRFGQFEFNAWYDGRGEVYSIHLSDLARQDNVPCRLHSSCITSHYFNGRSCDCVEQMEQAQAFIQKEGVGIIIVLMQEAKGNGVLATANYDKFSAGTTNSTEVFARMGLPRDNRDYRAAAFILKEMNVSSIRLLSNSPTKRDALEHGGIRITSMQDVVAQDRKDLSTFYQGKRDIEGHRV
jgi:3,4-dihydroxy 2-butanone 4-phosphate synthase/GTP cyclohydrolase II